MRIVVVGPTYQNQPQSITAALRRLGHEVLDYPLTEFYVGCTYWQRKLYKLGYHGLEKKYNARQAASLRSACDAFHPDLVFVLNGLMISTQTLESIRPYSKILWLWDGLARCPRLETVLPYFKNVLTFEYGDAEQLRARGWQAAYMPLGYDDQLFYPQQQERDIDISFIGIPNADRLAILNQVARHAAVKNWSMFIGGPWYSARHFWKRRSFQRKYPCLYSYLHNRTIEPVEAADIYRRSKICLNINVCDHKSLNPRTFEIMATKSLMLMNGDIDFHGLIHAEDFIHFAGCDDIIQKIDELLKNTECRARVAGNGFKSVSGSLSYTVLMKKVMDMQEQKDVR